MMTKKKAMRWGFGALILSAAAVVFSAGNAEAQASGSTVTHEVRVTKKFKRKQTFDIGGRTWSCSLFVCTYQGPPLAAGVKACTRFAHVVDSEVTYLRYERELSAAELTQCRDYYLKNKK
jgi:hypothetical protein